jgi:hypothetical protein
VAGGETDPGGFGFLAGLGARRSHKQISGPCEQGGPGKTQADVFCSVFAG